MPRKVKTKNNEREVPMEERIERPIYPSEVAHKAEERTERAEALRVELRRLAFKGGHEGLIVGQLLYDIRRQRLWEFYSDSWAEFVNDVGLSTSLAHQRQAVYETFVLICGLDLSDNRLCAAATAKLQVGTRKAFQPWILKHLDEFLDLASLPLGDGGLTRNDLQAYIEEQLGLEAEDEDGTVRATMRSLRRSVVKVSSLADDGRDVLAQLVRDDDDVMNVLSDLLALARAKQSYSSPPEDVVDIEDDEGEDNDNDDDGDDSDSQRTRLPYEYETW